MKVSEKNFLSIFIITPWQKYTEFNLFNVKYTLCCVCGYTVKTQNILTPKLIAVIISKVEQLAFTMQLCVLEAQMESHAVIDHAALLELYYLI